ncbi:hypothetical protein BGZ63DRAFT_426953 [Mariannaea sp. PMI_226]|nr:hypothetical protein BGZ63DRAFT_426953 [Mariannaea sp. PMI_226]
MTVGSSDINHATVLDEDALAQRFDKLVSERIIFYDPNPKIIKYEDEGYKFEFRITRALKNKPDIPSGSQDTTVNSGHPALSSIPGSDINVSGFEIQPIGATHLLTYNMFSGFRPHFLLLTQDGYRKQYEPLDFDDIHAAHSVVSALNGEYMVLFNGGEESGCSRFHKHLQLIPHADTTFDVWRDIIDRGAKVPFQSFIRRFDEGLPNSRDLLTIYLELFEQAREALKQPVSSDGRAPPHNVIFDRRGIMVIPRRTAGIGRAGANAAGMLGIVWMSDDVRAQEWMDLGPTKILQTAGVPLETS